MIEERRLTIGDMEGVMPESWTAGSLFTGEVHPLADLWPMVGEAELEALAADIAANGLREPLAVDELGRLVDGRNRWAACKKAGVEPSFVMVTSGEARSLIFSRNAQRRNTTGAQRAMIGVLGDWNPQLNSLFKGRGAASDLASECNCTTSQVARAMRIMIWLPQKARAVADGTEKLEAVDREALEIEAKSKSVEARLEKLTEEDPEMAELVNTTPLTLEEAEAALKERKRIHKERVVQASRQLATILNYLDPGGIPVVEAAENWLLADEMATAPSDDFSLPRLERAQAVLRTLIERRKESTDEA